MAVRLDRFDEERMLHAQRFNHSSPVDESRPREGGNQRSLDADAGFAIQSRMESTDPAPDGGVNVQVDDRAEIALPRYGEFESAMPWIARDLAVPQGDQLPDFLV